MGFSNRFKSPEFPLDKYITPSYSRSPSQPFLQQTNLQDYLCSSPHQHFPASSRLSKPLLTPIENLPRRDISPISFKRMSTGSPLDPLPDFYRRQNSFPNLPPQNNPTAVIHKGRILIRKDSNSELSSYRRAVTERAESPEIIKPVSPDKLSFMQQNYRNNNMPIIRDKLLPKVSSRGHMMSAEEHSRLGRTSRSSPPIRFPSLDENRGRGVAKRLVSFGETQEIEYEKYELPMTLNQVLSKIEAEIKEEVNVEEGKYVGSLKKKAKYGSDKEKSCMAMTFGRNFEENNDETNLNYLKGLNSSRQQNCPLTNNINLNPVGGGSKSILRARKFRADSNNGFVGKNEELRQEVTLLKMQYDKETRFRNKSPNQKFTKAKRMQSIRNQI